MILTLPDVLIRSIFSFSTYSDTLKAATLCHGLRDHVEAFSGEQLNKIRETHQVDPSWNYRLGMQVNIPRERQPPTLSNRHMLKVARQTHLYSLSDRAFNRGVRCLSCLPDENTLISAGHDNLIRVWDLTAQRCVRTLEASTQYGIQVFGFFALHFVAGRIVSVSRYAMVTWKLDGTLLYEIDFRLSWVSAFASCGNHVFNAFQNNDNGIYTICATDVLSGERVREKVQEWSVSGPYIVQDMAVKDEWLLVLVRNEEEVNYEAPAGIHVLKQSDLEEESLFRGNFQHMACSEKSKYIVASSESGEINIFSVEVGRLVRIRSFAASASRRYGEFFVSGSFVYTTIYPNEDEVQDEENQFISVFDINSGERVGRLHFPSFDASTSTELVLQALASNGREVFCGFIIDYGRRSMSTIKAYPVPAGVDTGI